MFGKYGVCLKGRQSALLQVRNSLKTACCPQGQAAIRIEFLALSYTAQILIAAQTQTTQQLYFLPRRSFRLLGCSMLSAAVSHCCLSPSMFRAPDSMHTILFITFCVLIIFQLSDTSPGTSNLLTNSMLSAVQASAVV
jgi:predicted membrane channel-forming protein YqfA (hemolysin III family)